MFQHDNLKFSAPNSQQRSMNKFRRRSSCEKNGSPTQPMVYEGIPLEISPRLPNSFFSQLLRGRNFFIGRRWELGAENLGLSCWNMLFETPRTDFFVVDFFSKKMVFEIFLSKFRGFSSNLTSLDHL